MNFLVSFFRGGGGGGGGGQNFFYYSDSHQMLYISFFVPSELNTIFKSWEQGIPVLEINTNLLLTEFDFLTESYGSRSARIEDRSLKKGICYSR